MNTLYTLDIKDIKDKEIDFVKLSSNKKTIHITRQKTGFGYKRFLQCPICKSRRTKLYSYDQENVYCRSCSSNNIYKGITDTTKGGARELSYRMHRIAEKYNIKLKFPFSYKQLLLEKPKCIRHKTWFEVGMKLQILENMRFQAITWNKQYEPKFIKYTLDNCLYVYEIWEVEKYLFDWEKLYRFYMELEKEYDNIC